MYYGFQQSFLLFMQLKDFIDRPFDIIVLLYNSLLWTGSKRNIKTLLLFPSPQHTHTHTLQNIKHLQRVNLPKIMIRCKRCFNGLNQSVGSSSGLELAQLSKHLLYFACRKKPYSSSIIILPMLVNYHIMSLCPNSFVRITKTKTKTK